MGDKSGIEWTDATWNPVVGCSLVSPGCTNCYAMKQAQRCASMGLAKYAGLTQVVKGKAVWTGAVRLDEASLEQPLQWRRPRRIFVNSMSDLFHEALPDEAIDKVFAVMALCPQHIFQVLTKRADRMREWVTFLLRHRRPGFPLPNVWLGVSVEDQARADERIPLLLDTPAAVRFLSCEPLLGPVDLAQHLELGEPGHTDRVTRLDWVIVGGESGPGARPMHPLWAADIRDQCAAAGVPFFFKQWGEWAPVVYGDRAAGARFVNLTGGAREIILDRAGGSGLAKDPVNMRRVGKHAAGRDLGGRTHDDFPRGAP